MLLADDRGAGGALDRRLGLDYGGVYAAVDNVNEDRIQSGAQFFDSPRGFGIHRDLPIAEGSVVGECARFVGFVVIGLGHLPRI